MNVEFEDAEHKYRIIGQIGDAGGTAVYKAEWEQRYNKRLEDYSVVWMRYAKVSDTVGFEKLKSQVRQHNSLISKAFIMHLREPFYYCVVSPDMGQGSLLTLMADRFPGGLPETGILFFLYRTLQGLNSIHRSDVYHHEISAAHIFLVGSVDARLGYASTVYDLPADQDSCSCYMPASSVCRWAAAPEVYGLITSNADHHYSYKAADGWLIGITALELAYGGLKLSSRDDLEFLLRTIHYQEDLPYKLKQDEHRSWNKDKRLLHFLPSSLNTNKRLAPTRFQFPPKERLFSKPFVDFVLACLHFDPQKRPRCRQLLQYKLFDEARCTDSFNL